MILLTVSLCFALPLHAEEILAKVQRELRARKFYFGEIQGRATDETVAAIRKFQEARGFDNTGNLGGETLRALGLPVTDETDDEARTLQECCNLVHRYVQAREKGGWVREGPLLADTVNYYDDGVVSRDRIRKLEEDHDAKWPNRKFTLLQRVAAFVPDHKDAVQVTARVRFEAGASASPQAEIEDLLIRLEKIGEGWRIAAVKLL